MNRFICSILLMLFAVGCGANRPSPLSLEEIPAAFKKTFANAKEETRFVVDGIIKQVEHKQFAPAAFQLQNMLSDRSLTKEQHSVISRGMMTLNETLQKQAEIQETASAPVSAPGARPAVAQTPAEAAAANPQQSSAEAAAYLRMYRQTK
jgi:hypothetical protein